MNKNVCLYLYTVCNIESFLLIFQKLRNIQSLKSIIFSNFVSINDQDFKNYNKIIMYKQIFSKCVEIIDWML